MPYLTVDCRALSKEDEARLSLAAQAGDVAARNVLVESNIPLVVVVVKTLGIVGGPLAEDLIQEGTLGLLKAVEEYEPARGYRFSTYAVWWIRAFIFKHMAANSHIVAHRYDVDRLADVPLDAVKKSNAGNGVSDQGGENGANIESLPDPAPSAEEAIIRLEQQAIVRHTVKKAADRAMTATDDPKVIDIVKSRVLSERRETLQSIGSRWGLSRERIRQVEALVMPSIRRAVVKRLAG